MQLTYAMSNISLKNCVKKLSAPTCLVPKYSIFYVQLRYLIAELSARSV